MVSGEDQLETLDFVVYGSSLHLFKNIRLSMNRCTSFSKGKSLFNLQIAFKNVFQRYTQLLKKKLPAKTFEESANATVLTDNDEMKCVYLINTCEYCLDTIPQLHQTIEDIISEEFVDNVDLKDNAEDMFREVINSSVMALVKSIEGRNEKIYSDQLLKTNWLQFEQVSDTSAYIKTVMILAGKSNSDASNAKKKQKVRVISATFCTYDIVTRRDIRVEINFPGSTNVVAYDEHG